MSVVVYTPNTALHIWVKTGVYRTFEDAHQQCRFWKRRIVADHPKPESLPREFLGEAELILALNGAYDGEGVS